MLVVLVLEVEHAWKHRSVLHLCLAGFIGVSRCVCEVHAIDFRCYILINFSIALQFWIVNIGIHCSFRIPWHDCAELGGHSVGPPHFGIIDHPIGFACNVYQVCK